MRQVAISAILVVALTLSVVTGCRQAPESESSAAEPTAGSGKVTIRYTEVEGIGTPTTQKLIARFNKEHPNIFVKFEPVSGQGFFDKMKMMCAANSAPDCWRFDDEPLHYLRAKGAFMDLQPFIDRDKLDLEDFPKVCVDLFRWEGHLYALPMDGVPEVMFYNRDLFDAAELPYPDESWTWDTFLDAAKKLTRDTNGDGRPDQYGFMCATGWWVQWLPWIWMVGGRVLNDDHTECLLDSPEAIRGITFYADLMLKHHVAPSVREGQADGMAWYDWFATDRIAMYCQVGAALFTFREYKTLNWDMAFLPKGPKGRVTRYTGSPLVMYAKTQHPEETWTFMKYISSKEVEAELVPEFRLPLRKSIAATNLWLDPKTPWNEKIVSDSMAFARPQPLIPEYDEMGTLIQEEIDAMLIKGQSPAESARKMKQKVDALLKRGI